MIKPLSALAFECVRRLAWTVFYIKGFDASVMSWNNQRLDVRPEHFADRMLELFDARFKPGGA